MHFIWDVSNDTTIEIIDTAYVLGHESCLHFLLGVLFEIRHVGFAPCAKSS